MENQMKKIIYYVPAPAPVDVETIAEIVGRGVKAMMHAVHHPDPVNVAIHEASHCIVALASGVVVVNTNIVCELGAWGVCSHRPAPSSQVDAAIAVAGAVGEVLFQGDIDALRLAGPDLEAVGVAGLDVGKAVEDAVEFLKANWPAVLELAGRLQEYGEVDERAINEIYNRHRVCDILY